jgi:hypothetical protein
VEGKNMNMLLLLLSCVMIAFGVWNLVYAFYPFWFSILGFLMTAIYLLPFLCDIEDVKEKQA